MNTAGQTADFNSSAGAEIKVVTKRGTNHFTAPRTNTTKTTTGRRTPGRTTKQPGHGPHCHTGFPYHYSRFGGAIGGPLIPKEILGGKTYFFFNYEGFRFPNSETITRNVPSPALGLGLLTDSTYLAVDLQPEQRSGDRTTGQRTRRITVAPPLRRSL